MFCSNCGAQLEEGDCFCRLCGKAKPGAGAGASDNAGWSERKVIVLDQKLRTLGERVDALEDRIPHTALLSHRIVIRALAIYGHLLWLYLVVLAVVLGIIVIISILLLLGSSLAPR